MKLPCLTKIPALFLLTTTSALAGDRLVVSPQFPTDSAPVTIGYESPLFACPNVLQAQNITRVGTRIRIDYVVVGNPNFVCFLPPPISFSADLGRLPIGAYTVSAQGTVNGVPHAFPEVEVNVVAAGQAPWTVPTTTPAGLGLLVTMMALVAGWALRSAGTGLRLS